MRIALFHNYYQTPGGEDRMFELECEALAALGHHVFPYVVRNDSSLSQASPLDKARTAWNAPYNKSSFRAISEFLRRHEVDIGHVHNWFPIISPAIYEAHKQLSIPVVQTLHNYRLGCANGTFRLKGKACDACLGGSRLPAVTHRCYRNSALGSYAWKRIMDQNWSNGRFADDVDAYISPSQEVAATHLKMGLPSERIHVIPNAAPEPPQQSIPTAPDASNGAIFVGRLSQEKGIDTLIDAWQGVDAPLVIAGSGPEEADLRYKTGNNARIQLLGHIASDRVFQQLEKSAFLVFPSRWAEPFGLGIIEAMAVGRPVIASNIGAPAEIIEHGVNGLLVPPDDPKALRQAVMELLSNPDRLRKMGLAARDAYLRHYRPQPHAEALESLYRQLLQESSSPTSNQSSTYAPVSNS